MPSPRWLDWEYHVQDVLGLDATPASGARFQAVGDAVDNRHPADTAFPLLADCKHTVKRSYNLTAKLWQDWQLRAAEAGKRFVLPVRIEPGDGTRTDVVVIGLDDFAELVERAR